MYTIFQRLALVFALSLPRKFSLTKKPNASMSFSHLNLSSALLNALTDQNYSKPFPIQEKAIPAILKQKDVLGIAQTGSGKTASYVLPILQLLMGDSKTKNRHVKALVLVPTRELAIQVNDVFQQFSQALPDRIKTLAVYGGVSINPQMMAMQNTHVLVATPGRLLELVASNAVHLSGIDTLVLDEADKMLDLGFKDEMANIFKLLPTKRQNLLFSATLSDDLSEIRDMLLRDPLLIKIEDKKEEVALIDQVGYFVADDQKGPLLRYLIKEKNMQQVLVFASSIYKADNIANKLRKNGIEAEAIHGKKSQQKRKNTLRDFKDGSLRVLVATDLLSRGIDIEFLPYVINYELPRSPKDYIHRIGRTGRAESTGQAITLVTPEDQHHFKVIQKKMKKWVDMIDSENLDIKGY